MEAFFFVGGAGIAIAVNMAWDFLAVCATVTEVQREFCEAAVAASDPALFLPTSVQNRILGRRGWRIKLRCNSLGKG